MSSSEVAAYIRGYELREVSNRKYIRWAIAAIMSMWAEKGKTIQPTDLILFPDEQEDVAQSAKDRKEQMEKVFEKWDKAKNKT